MKTLRNLGLSIFIVGIILFFIREFSPATIVSIEGKYIDLLWPIGLMIYGIAQVAVDQSKKSNKGS